MNWIKSIEEKKLFVIILLVHLIASIFSVGFHQYDEHFQILEFLQVKLFNTGTEGLPWEFSARLRPWFQVWLYYLWTAPLSWLGIKSPFVLSFILRLLTGALGVLSIWCLRDYLKKLFSRREDYLLALFFLGLFWFVPYIHVRTSAESLSSSLLLIGFALSLKALEKNPSLLLSLFGGVVLGSSYLAKFQTGIPVAFLWFWIVIFHPKRWKVYTAISLGVIVAMALGPVFDYWGYGEWVFTPWNYFRVNLIEGKASEFGVDPWYYYLRKGLAKGIPPISLFLIGSMFYFWIKKYKDPFTWISLSFFLVHVIIGHKEVRFLFPLYCQLPIFFFFTYTKLRDITPRWSNRLMNFTFYLNAILLLGVILKPAHKAMPFYRFVHAEGIKEVIVKDEDPFSMWKMPLTFYRPKPFNALIDKNIQNRQSEGIYFFRKGSDYLNFVERKNCQAIYTSFPAFFLNINIGNWVKRSKFWSLFHCKFQQTFP
jgi:phosphatidylinositol glycan class B